MTSISSIGYLTSYATSSASSSGCKTLLDALSSSSNDEDSSDDLYDLLKANSGMRDYNLLTDGSGNVYIPTIDEMNAATTPSGKLTMASGVAEKVLMQADACSKTGIATRSADIIDQAASVMDAVSDAIDLATNGTAADDDATRSKLSTYKQTISETLESINSALSEITGLLSKVSADEKDAIVSTLKELDAMGATLAKESGVKWTSFTGNSDNTVKGYSASEAADSSSSSSKTSNLLDILA